MSSCVAASARPHCARPMNWRPSRIAAICAGREGEPVGNTVSNLPVHISDATSSTERDSRKRHRVVTAVVDAVPSIKRD